MRVDLSIFHTYSETQSGGPYHMRSKEQDTGSGRQVAAAMQFLTWLRNNRHLFP